MPRVPGRKPRPPTSAVAARNGRPRTATAASRIYADLRAELVSLQRRPGEAISEAEIALSYGVSRTPVREAILKLSDEGLVEIFPQSGIIVSRIRSRRCRRPSSSARRWRKPRRGWRRSAQRASQILALHVRSSNGSARPTPPATATPSIRPMNCFTPPSPRSPDIPASGS